MFKVSAANASSCQSAEQLFFLNLTLTIFLSSYNLNYVIAFFVISSNNLLSFVFVFTVFVLQFSNFWNVLWCSTFSGSQGQAWGEREARSGGLTAPITTWSGLGFCKWCPHLSDLWLWNLLFPIKQASSTLVKLANNYILKNRRTHFAMVTYLSPGDRTRGICLFTFLHFLNCLQWTLL